MSVANLASALAWVRETVPEGAELRLDSRRIEKGDVFIAVPGLKVDGRNFIKATAEKGAGAVLIDAAPGSAEIPEGIPALEVEGLSKSLGRFASLYYGNPSGAMEGFAVTGTNGKTTTSQWMASILTELGTPCGVLGTIGCTMNGRSYSSVPLTTPDPVTLQTLLAELHRDGAKAFSIEASSIGLVQGRLDGTAISYALFTNLTRDHLDYHGTMEAYEEAKSLLFRWEGLKCSVINIDDPAGLRLCRVSLDAGVRVIAATAVGTKAPEGCELLEARDVQIGAKGIAFTLCWAGEERHVEAGVLGLFNVDNMIGAIGMMLASGRDLDDVIRVAERLAPPPGRLQKITHPDEPMGVVDYCHTPDAIEKALTTLRPVAEARGGKLWAIVGAGGNRDPGKRPIMGAIAEKLSDKLVVTSDNPRFEDPKTIAEAVAAGAHSPEIVVDRREAIQEVFSRAGAADVILVAGKGHEDYQEVCGVKHHFSDAEEVEAALQSRMAKEKEEKSE